MMRRALVGMLAMLLVPLALVGPATAQQPVRVLILGDSVTQGSAGDWTWRYRAWQALTDADVAVDFVGPRDDLFDLETGQFGNDDYAHPDFDRAHAARWGMAIGFPDWAITDLVEKYKPDVVVEARGINDLTWLQARSADLARSIGDEIQAARTVDPDIDFVVTQLPWTWLGQDEDGQTAVQAYNQVRLPQLAESMSSEESRVVVAQSGSGFVEFVDTWDMVHLTASGEVTMAAAVVDALATLGVGKPYPRPFPVLENGHWGIATDVAATPQLRAVRLDWRPPPGGVDTHVWMRDATVGGDWSTLPAPVQGRTWTVGDLVGGDVYEFRLQSAKGAAVSPQFSEVVSATALASLPAVPAPVTGLKVAPGLLSLSVSWTAAADATSYDVTWSADGVSRGAMNVDRPEAELEGLEPGVLYAVTVTARNAGGLSDPVTVSGTPDVPPPIVPPASVGTLPLAPVAGVRARSPRRDRVRTTAHAVPSATAYRLQVATARSCRKHPMAKAFHAKGHDRTVPVATVRTKARALWVRWYAVRNGVRGPLDRASSACTRVR
jgi:hypothetical protein